MKHFIVGTAGHIDHGKTSLIKALTNMDCDTHPEEKKRGITINLGFAYIRKSDGEYMAFVDVPGHHRFIANMIAGASGIDFVMLVVAANDGVMPQTKEHLMICSLLGIKNGIVVINKCDAVGEDDIELCREEIVDFVRGTFLEGKPIFEVSSLTGKGIDVLRNYLMDGDYDLTLRMQHDFFRMGVDRVFNVAGFGAVVTGTVAAGEVRIGDNVTLLPGGTVAKVRGIQRHTEQIESSGQGTRVAIDLAGVKREAIDFGDVLCAVPMCKTDVVDVKMMMMTKLDDDVRKFDAVMLCGTAKLSVKVKLLDSFTEQSNEYALAQIYLPKEWYFSVNDYFILRNSSFDTTISGGFVVDALPLHHKNITDVLKLKLHSMCEGALSYVCEKVNESVELLTVDYFVPILQFTPQHIQELLTTTQDIVLLEDGALLPATKIKEFETILMMGFEKFAKRNPLSAIGVSRKKMMEFVGDFSFFRFVPSNDKAVSLVLDSMEREGRVVRRGNQWSLPGARTEISERERNNIKKIENIIASYGYSPLDMDALFLEAKQGGVDDAACRYIVTYLTDLNRIVRIDGMAFNNEKLNEARTRLIDYLKGHLEEGIKAADYRDLIGTNRKNAVILLELFDKEKIVIRKDDVRFLKQ